MNKGKPIETDYELFCVLEAFFGDGLESASSEFINAELKELVFDVDLVGKRLGSIARETLTKSPDNWRNKSHEIAFAKEKLNHFRVLGIETLDRSGLITGINQALALLDKSQSNVLPVFNRNFQEASENDLKSLLEQLQILIQQGNSLGN